MGQKSIEVSGISWGSDTYIIYEELFFYRVQHCLLEICNLILKKELNNKQKQDELMKLGIIS